MLLNKLLKLLGLIFLEQIYIILNFEASLPTQTIKLSQIDSHLITTQLLSQDGPKASV